MQWPEVLLLAALTAAALSALLRGWAPYRRRLLALALVLGIAEGWYRVAPWQLLPAALAWVVLVWTGRQSAGEQTPDRRMQTGAAAALALLSASAGLLIVLPFFALPRPTGSYAVGTLIVDLTDQSRTLAGQSLTPETAGNQRRALVVQLWYPADRSQRLVPARYVRAAEVKPQFAYQAGIRTNASAAAPPAASGAPFPVLLYGHSWGSRRTVDTFLAEELASHGYIVLAIDHPLNAARVELPGGTVIRGQQANALANLEGTDAARVLKLWGDELAVWVADDRFVLSRLAAATSSSAAPDALGWLRGRADLNRVGAFGHSFGGASSLALLGQPDAPGIPRVRAAVNLDGWTFQGLDHRTTQPILTIYAGAPDPPARPGVEGVLDADDHAAVESSISRFGGSVLYIPRTQHLDFTDQTLVSPFQRLTYTGPMAGARIRTITRGLVVRFFDRTLKASAEPMPSYPEVQTK